MADLRLKGPEIVTQVIKNEILKEELFDVAHHVDSDPIDSRKTTDVSIIMYSRDMRKWTPLHYASYNGHAKAVSFLLKQEADQDELHLKKNTQKRTAFIVAKSDAVKKAFSRKFELNQ